MRTGNGVYIVRPTDYYGEVHEAIARGVHVLEYPETYKMEDRLVLQSGMKLLVRWPDGKIGLETIKIETGRTPLLMDMGGDVEYQHVCVVHQYHGVEVLIPLKKGTQVRLSRR